MWIEFASIGGIAFVAAAVSTPLAGRLAHLLQVVDHPNPRKVNKRPNIPLLGGLAVLCGVAVGLAALKELTPAFDDYRRHFEGFLIGGGLIFAAGLWDDRFGMRARTKLGLEVAAAAVAIYFGFRVDHFVDPVLQQNWQLSGWLMVLLTGAWIVGITNAINLIDGLDGLATGVSAIIAGTLAYICFSVDQLLGTYLGVALLGALLGFLPFNFPPARIFLGDAGALFVGYCVSLLSIAGAQDRSVITFVVPLFALAVPILDTVLSIIRRLRSREHVFSPDRQHMHHQLLEAEGSQRSVVLLLYFVTSCFCVIAISFTRLAGYGSIFFFIAVMLLTVRMVRNMGLLGRRTHQAPASGDSPTADEAAR